MSLYLHVNVYNSTLPEKLCGVFFGLSADSERR